MNKLFNSLMITAAISSGAASLAHAAEPAALWHLDNLDQPESVIAGPKGRFLYVSNINGQPAEMNGRGYISRITTEGKLVDKAWITGLDAPKGMGISKGFLYVADMQTLHVISLAQGKVVKRFQAPKAKMLNDVTVGDHGEIYVSDLLGGTIYRLYQDSFNPWFSHLELPYPNGVLWHQGALYIGNWGVGMNADFTTNEPGTLFRLNTQTQELKPVATGYQLGNIDGIVADQSGLYVSDWITGELYHLSAKERRKVQNLKAGLADIGSSANGIIYAPMMMDNQVIAWKMK